MGKDYYKILGINKTYSQPDIKKAYRKLALQFHPDKNKSDSAETRFKDISEAYAVLSDKSKKKLYDQYGEDGLKMGDSDSSNTYSGFNVNQGFRFESMDAHNIFSQVFGNSGVNRTFNIRTTARDTIHKIYCSLEELYVGKTKKMKITKRIQDSNTNSITTVSKLLTIDIKPGWKQGTKIRFNGEGDDLNRRPPDNIVFIIIEKPHDRFTRDGDDLKYNINLSFTESFCGYTRTIEGIDGKKLNISMDTVVLPKNIHALSSNGMPKKNGSRGDLVLTYNIKYPSKLTDKQKEIIKDANFD